MGTETANNSAIIASKRSALVKLNNPLMGTETLGLMIS